VAAVLGGVVGASVPHTVAFREGAIEQDVVRVCLTQGAQQSGRAVGEQMDHPAV
jgi:hypothetical protein